jgi:hypothetical protein
LMSVTIRTSVHFAEDAASGDRHDTGFAPNGYGAICLT